MSEFFSSSFFCLKGFHLLCFRLPSFRALLTVVLVTPYFSPICFLVVTPEYPKGRKAVVIANDITFKIGSFGPPEDDYFFKATEMAKKLGLPRSYRIYSIDFFCFVLRLQLNLPFSSSSYTLTHVAFGLPSFRCSFARNLLVGQLGRSTRYCRGASQPLPSRFR